MIKINIHEMKVHFSKYLKKLREGDTIVICKRNVPIAEIRGLNFSRLKKRPIGLAKGEFSVPASFFEPLPQELLSQFEGDVE
jgi:antitoxin (DNA-binding transcriptional repressor) of toxin-antitoxin stability system